MKLVRGAGARSAFIVGTGKNVGKTVTMRAMYEAAYGAGLRVGLASVGRDGEAMDAGDSQPKPRLFLRPQTLVATAREVVPASPASEIVALGDLHTAAGGLIFVRVRTATHYELVGPPTASGMRQTVERLCAQTDIAFVDGAIDRVAALAGGSDAIVVACGASAAPTMQEAVNGVSALVARLRIAPYDPAREWFAIEGALTASTAAALLARREQRQVVVRDPTQIALTGKAAARVFATLDIRCERALHVVATTVASIGRDRSFEPLTFLRAVAAATNLPTFDVYAGMRAA
ncbi:MAG: hypothetical protein JO092_10735 [Candidatus Eremiobacteraeota bacterium]|nr:hypothetical protein [Candidatus Eremiobacteraeota bacterium]